MPSIFNKCAFNFSQSSNFDIRLIKVQRYLIYLFLFYLALDLKKGEVYEGQPKGGKADTTLTVSDSDMVDIAFGKLQAQAAYMRGKLKIKGNIMLTQKLVPLLKSGPKL